MYLSDILSALRRLWFVVLLGLIMSAGLVLVAHAQVPVKYESRAYTVLLPPKNTVNSGGNPFLALGGLQQPTEVLARAVTDTKTVEEIAPPAGDAEFTVQPDASTSGPVLQVTATDLTRAGSVATLNAVLRRLPAVLDALQDSVNAPAASHIRMEVVTRDSIAKPVIKQQIRAMIVAVVAGMGATLVAASSLDGLLMRRRERRELEDAFIERIRGRDFSAPVRTGETEPPHPAPKRGPRPKKRVPSAESTRVDV